MPVERIVDAGDPRLVEFRDLPEPELVRRRGLFIVEGRLVVRRLIEDGRFAVRSLLVSSAALRSLEPTLTRLAPDVPIYVCAASDFRGITGYDIHRGCLALAARPDDRRFEDLLAA